jgi:hypothetical protein
MLWIWIGLTELCVEAPGTTGSSGVARSFKREPLREGSAALLGVACAAVVVRATVGTSNKLSTGLKRNRSPLREGPAIARAAPAAITVEESSSAPASGGECENFENIGFDVLSVKRGNAPEVKCRQTGNFAKARAAISTRKAASIAVGELRLDVYARSTMNPRQRKFNTLRALSKAADPPFELLPLQQITLETLAAAFKAGGYRTGGAYLQIARKEHILAGHEWSPALQIALKDAERSITRGMGAPSHAADFRLETLAQCDSADVPGMQGAPISPVEVGLCMALWMLRGSEAAALLGEQVAIDKGVTTAVLNLGPTKEDITGRGCKRTLVCACSGAASSQRAHAICPVHAIAKVMEERERLGLSAKHPLFPQEEGRASTAAGVYKQLSALLKTKVTEHSFRRAGAQYYARRGVSIGIIQFIGRWGSETVYRYIDEALDHTARLAARQAAQSDLLPICPTAVEDRIEPALKIISELSDKSAETGDAVEIVARAVKAACVAVDAGCSALELKLMTKMAAVTGAVRGVGRAASRAQTHRIALGDACYPTELWTTACGWRFGSAPHIRVDISEITCASCKRCTGEVS